MIQGFFSDRGELYFELDLIARDGSSIPADVLLDTGFTDWLVMNVQDIESLDWPFIKEQEKQTAQGDATFYLYQGNIIFEGQEYTIPVLGGEEITNILIGLPWLEERRLVVDKKAGLLTLGED